jgi:3-oxoacyl-[acyl-carrier-protein] synthase II
MALGSLRDRRVVVTGLGSITPFGDDARRTFDALCHGETGIRPIRRFDVAHCPSKIGAIIEDFDPQTVITDRAGRRLLRTADWVQALGLCAAEVACRDARIEAGVVAPERLGVFFGAGRGGMEAMEAMSRTLFTLFRDASPGWQEGQPEAIEDDFRRLVGNVFSLERPTNYLRQCPCLVSTYVAIRYKASGPALTNVNLCSAGAQAIGEAAWVIARDDADVMIAGGADSMLNAAELTAFCSLDAVSTRNDDGPAACKPFDLRRDGCVVGEGGAVLVLEALEHAERRGAPIYAEVLGYGSSMDGYKITAPPEDGAGAVLAMRRALQHAGLAPGEVDHINAHGTATPLNDRIETEAIKTVFGAHAYRMPVVSTKSMTGHLIAAAGALEAVITVQSVAGKRVPPTRNLHVPDPRCDLDYVPEGERVLRGLRVALSNSFAIGGSNACLVFGEAPTARAAGAS